MHTAIENPFISVIIPAFNEEGNLSAITTRIVQLLDAHFRYEIIFVDDGSTDGTLGKLKELHRQNQNIQYISFSRNFGHQSALLAGFHFANGDCVITMDADLQHPPELIPQMIQRWQEGNDIVTTIRSDMGSPSFFKRTTSSLFYKFMNKISNTKMEEGAADFRLVDRAVAAIISNSKEYNLFLRGYISWLGFKQTKINYTPNERNSGETKYSFGKMFWFALNGITSFSIRPLRIAIVLGTVISFLAFMYALYAIIIYLTTNRAVPGWTSVLFSVLFIGGLQLLIMGIVGEYIGRVLMQTKMRPDYVVMEKSF